MTPVASHSNGSVPWSRRTRQVGDSMPLVHSRKSRSREGVGAHGAGRGGEQLAHTCFILARKFRHSGASQPESRSWSQ